jgi:hypothetical protein
MSEAMNKVHNFVLAEIDGQGFLFDQSQVASVESVLQLPSMAAVTPYAGADGVELPVLSLSSALEALDDIPASRKFFLVFVPDAQSGERYGLTCDNVLTVTRSQLEFWPVPPAMQQPGTPALELARRNGEERYYVLIDAGRTLAWSMRSPAEDFA